MQLWALVVYVCTVHVCICICVWVPAHAALAWARAAGRWGRGLIGPAVIWPLQILNYLRETQTQGGKDSLFSLFVYTSSACCVGESARVCVFYLFTSRGQFVRICCQHSEVIDDGLEVSDLSQHGDLSVLQNKIETRSYNLLSSTSTLPIIFQPKAQNRPVDYTKPLKVSLGIRRQEVSQIRSVQ